MTRREDRLFRRYRQHGNPRDLAAVFDLTATDLLQVALHLTRDAHQSEDLLQSTFLVAVEDAASWDDQRPLLPWLLGILANRVRDLRRRARRELDPQRLSLELVREPSDSAALQEFAGAAGEALRDLHEPYRQVLLLHLEHGLSAKEIAEVLDRPAGTVRTQISRGLQALRDALPAGFVASTALLASAGRGLAAVKRCVLEQAGSSTGWAASVAVPTSIGGLLLMKNVWIVLVASGLLGFGIWNAFEAKDVLEDLPVSPELQLGKGAEVDVQEVPAPETAAAPGRTAITGFEGETELPLDLGDLLVHVTYPDGGAAAGVVLVMVGGEPLLTDSEGKHLYEGLDSGKTVTVQVPQSSRQGNASIQAERVETLRITIPRGLELQGQVVNRSGQPVAGAMVLTRGNFEFHRKVATTDTEGTFTLKDYYPNQSLMARAAGYQPSKIYHPKGNPGQQVKLRLVLGDAGRCLAGIVRRPDGGSLAAARLALLHLGTFHTPPPVLLISDDEGRFATDQAAAGPHLLTVLGGKDEDQLGALLEFEIPDAGLHDLEVSTHSGGELYGKVLDEAGQPLASQQVVARFRHPKLHSLPFARKSTYTDREGKYRIASLLPGTYEVESGDSGNRVREEVVIVADAKTRWDPVFAGFRDLTLKLVDAARQPLANWRLDLLNDLGFPTHGNVTDSDGLVTFQRLRTSGHRFWVQAPVGEDEEFGFAYARIPNLITKAIHPGEGDHIIMVLPQHMPTVRIKGRVVDAGGKPLAGTVTVYIEGDNTVQEDEDVASDSQTGTFAIGPLAAHRYRVYVRVKGRPTRVLRDQATEPGQDLDLGDIEIADASWVEVTVRGDAADGLRVHLRDGHSVLRLSSKGGGRFCSSVLQPGEYELQVTGDRTAPRTETIKVAAGKNALDWDVKPALSQPVELVLQRNRPDRAHWACTLWIYDAHDKLVLVESTSDRLKNPESDLYALALGLLPGTYTIKVSGWEKSSGEAQFVVKAAPTTVRVTLR